MRWVTRPHVHLDRVATPWLIRRFVDREAEFSFVNWLDDVPDGATAFGFHGGPLASFDCDGSTFRKVLLAYGASSAALQLMADAVEVGIAVALDLPLPPAGQQVTAYGYALCALSEGMAVLEPDDSRNLELSAPLYDSIYVSVWAGLQEHAAPLPADPMQRIAGIRGQRDWQIDFPAWTAG